MRTIDLETWPRRSHYETFKSFDNPRFDMCANVDLTAFRPAVKQSGFSFTIAVLYVLARAANDVPELRQRIHGETVVEYDVIHPSSTILVDHDLFSFAEYDYTEDFSVFAASTAAAIADVKTNPWVHVESNRDDQLYMTAIPWVSFTSFHHPGLSAPADSVPRMAWGKAFEAGGLMLMPLEIDAHHALVDGLHMARFYEAVQKYLDEPGTWLLN